MKEIKLESLSKFDESEYIDKILKNNKLFIYPTDTLYGIGGNFYSLEVINKIDKIKGRTDKPYSVAVSDLEMLKGMVKNIPDIFTEKYSKLLPGKYTFLFEIADHIDRDLVKGSNKIGIRIPESPEILRLIDRVGTPVITTSVNETGELPLNKFDDIIEFIKKNNFEQDISLIINGGDLQGATGSTIIDLTEEKPVYLR